ncbi:calcium uptake protein 3, mitochondrial isoform X2 [Denticeps clupeoides]|nr:calcium uptake protein 3, mitochondrial-like isoform X1 [Denticeps clupeoides]XP_028815765.1 calcium uptake protein 3, mitochondrial-like isoform X2 [Denticeps clupeoides]
MAAARLLLSVTRRGVAQVAAAAAGVAVVAVLGRPRATRAQDDAEEHLSAHEERFQAFGSVVCEGQIYMTPLDFLESVASTGTKTHLPASDQKLLKSLTRQELVKMVANTPPVGKRSSTLFRSLQHGGIITYTEYLFLLCILTNPHAGFKMAFNMFDVDGNERVDKQEFLVLEEIFLKRNKKNARTQGNTGTSVQLISQGNMTNSTLLVHFFGKDGKSELNFDQFCSFMENLQTEVFEIEFLNYSRGMSTISTVDFAQVLLRYTTVDNVSSYLKNADQQGADKKGITFEEFRVFFQFLNNLEDFAMAMQMYNFAGRSIGQEEFARAVYVATGLKLSPHLVDVVFQIFDVDHDKQLSYNEFIGIMKERRRRGSWGKRTEEGFTSFKICMKSHLSSK